MTASNGGLGDQLGKSVAINVDTVVAGAPNNGGTGAAYIFIKPGTGWADNIQTAKFENIGSAAGDLFGSSVTVNGDTVVVGDWKHATGGNQFQGTAFIFVKPALGWATYMNIPTATLVPGGGAAGDRFGSAVAIDGNTTVVGAYSQGSGDQGAAYVFVKSAAGWLATHTAQLLADDGSKDDAFGKAVAVSGETVVVGAPSYAIGTNQNQGTVYVYTRPTGGWSGVLNQSCRLFAENAVQGDSGFGLAVATNGNIVVTGMAFNQRNLYIFGTKTTDWTTVSGSLSQSDILQGKDSPYALGLSVALSGDTLVSGSLAEAVYLFTNVGNTFPWAMFLPAITIRRN